MFAILAAICFGIGFVVNASQTTGISPWLQPISMICAGGCFLALHLLGLGSWTPRRPD